MRCIVVWLLGLIGWGFPEIGHGQERATPPATPSAAREGSPARYAERARQELAQQIPRLGNPRFVVREEAQRRLFQAGPEALPLLRKAAASSDPEIRSRVVELVRYFEDLTENERLLEAPRLRLDFQKKPLREAVQTLAQQTGLPLELDADQVPNPQRPITVQTEALPLWQAIDRFYAATGLREVPAPNSNGAQSQVYLGGNMIRSTAYYRRPSGPQKILLAPGKFRGVRDAGSTAVRIRAIPRAELHDPLPTHSGSEITFGLDVRAAPPLNASKVIGVQIEKAFDQHGLPVRQSHTAASILGGDGTVYYNNVGGQALVQTAWPAAGTSFASHPHQIPVTVRTTRRDVQLLREVVGLVALRVQGQSHQLLRIDELHKQTANTTFQVEGITVQIVNILKKSNDRYSLQIKLEYSMNQNNPAIANLGVNPFGPGSDPAATSIESPELTILDGKGNALTERTSGSSRSSFNGVVIRQSKTFLYQQAEGQGIPETLVLSGRKPFVLRVPFRLKNVPLQ